MHAVHLVERRDHEDRNVAEVLVALEALEDVVAVEPGHQHVEEHEIERAGGERGQRVLAAARGGDLVPLPAEATGEQLARRRVVVDDEDGAVLRGGHRAHGGSAGAIRGRHAQRLRHRDAIVDERDQVTGGGFDLLDVRQHGVGGGARDRVAQRFEIRRQRRERRRQLREPGGQIARAGRRATRRQELVDASHQLARVAMDAEQRLGQVGRRRVVHFLQQHLAVPDDVVQWRPELVARVGQHGRGSVGDAHAGGLPPSSASILPSRRVSSIGLVS